MAAPDYLAEAAKAVLKPAVVSHGFQEYSKKMYFRVCGKVVQFLNLQKSSWGSCDFAVNYFIFVLVPHRQFVGSVFAGRLPRGKSGDGWWKSSSAELAERSMHDVREKFEVFAKPIFDGSSTLSGYVEAMKELSEGSPNAHFRADIGCALICDGKTEEGLRHIRKAEEEYRAFSAQFPRGPVPMWSDESADAMAALSTSIEAGRHESLIEDWYRQSVISLKIDKKWKP